ncbi:uncharacterized protein LOC110927870 [Helianthus annuus]|uniref:uncharacterized protein LOC110927870 n=1 Tax=Helianthus annuus TaxID=4232 RepID=UPI000B901FDD|nr:uncharacterized protein LOC110927870 [Helianthus annuus]
MDLEHNLHISVMKINEVSDVKLESDGISSQSEELNNLKEDLDVNLKTDEVFDLKPKSDDIPRPCEGENLVQKVDSGDDLMSAMKEHNFVVVQEEHSKYLLESVSTGDDADMLATAFKYMTEEVEMSDEVEMSEEVEDK